MKWLWLLIPLVAGCVDLGKIRDQVSDLEQKMGVNAEDIGSIKTTAVTKQEVNGVKAELEARLKAEITGLHNDFDFNIDAKLRDANIKMDGKLSAIEQRVGDMEGSGTGGILGIGGSGGIALLVVFVFVAAGVIISVVLLRRMKKVQLDVKDVRDGVDTVNRGIGSMRGSIERTSK